MLKNLLAVVVRFLRNREPIMFVGLLFVVAGTWAFIELADEVIEGGTGDFDRWAILELRRSDDNSIPIGPAWMAEVGRDLTGLGGIAVLTMVIVGTAGFLVIHRAYRTMLVLIVSTTSGIVVSLLLKQAFDRPRPDLVPHLSHVHTSSFPSGHSMMSAVVYLTLAAIVAPVLKHFWLRFYVVGCAALMTGLIGVSRVYMGVHYPTDVFAGWTAGLVWAITCWLIARTIPVRKVDTVQISN